MATNYDQSSATRPVSIRSHTSAFQVHFKHTSSALEMSSVNPPNDKNQEVTYQAETACVHPRLNRQFVSLGSPLLVLLTTLEDINSLGYLVFVNVDITHACLQFPF